MCNIICHMLKTIPDVGEEKPRLDKPNISRVLLFNPNRQKGAHNEQLRTKNWSQVTRKATNSNKNTKSNVFLCQTETHIHQQFPC